MKFFELLKVVRFEDVWDIILNTESATKRSKASVKRAFDELLRLKPDKKEPFVIGIEEVKSPEGTYFDVFCLSETEHGVIEHGAIETTRWRLWLWADISKEHVNHLVVDSFGEETLKDFTKTEIVAHCLWEMTFFGFSNKRQQERVRSIFRGYDKEVKPS